MGLNAIVLMASAGIVWVFFARLCVVLCALLLFVLTCANIAAPRHATSRQQTHARSLVVAAHFAAAEQRASRCRSALPELATPAWCNGCHRPAEGRRGRATKACIMRLLTPAPATIMAQAAAAVSCSCGSALRSFSHGAAFGARTRWRAATRDERRRGGELEVQGHKDRRRTVDNSSNNAPLCSSATCCSSLPLEAQRLRSQAVCTCLLALLAALRRC
jgi:hypothetical protein